MGTYCALKVLNRRVLFKLCTFSQTKKNKRKYKKEKKMKVYFLFGSFILAENKIDGILKNHESQELRYMDPNGAKIFMVLDY